MNSSRTEQPADEEAAVEGMLKLLDEARGITRRLNARADHALKRAEYWTEEARRDNARLSRLIPPIAKPRDPS